VLQLNLSRKNLLAILLGFLTILGIGILTTTISFLIHLNMARTLSPENFRAAISQHPVLTISWILRGLSFISPVIGGVVVGWITKEKGWLYGGLLGVILTLVSIGFASLTFILPTATIYGSDFPANYGHDLAQKNIVNQLIGAPLTIVLTSLGGWLGEKIHKKRKH